MRFFQVFILFSFFPGCTIVFEDSDQAEEQDQTDIIVEPVVTENSSLSFSVPSDVEFTCGTPVGMQVIMEDSEGEVHTCHEPFTNSIIPGPYGGDHLVADCFEFSRALGDWLILDVWVFNESDDPMNCCHAEYPEIYNNSGLTDEFSIQLSCDLLTGGAIDLFGWLDIGPVINDVDIEPSKFTTACVPITIIVDAYSPDNDTVNYAWEVISTPESGAIYQLTPSNLGDTAIFVSQTIGDYQIQLTVFELAGLKQEFSFPIHVTNSDQEDCCTCCQ